MRHRDIATLILLAMLSLGSMGQMHMEVLNRSQTKSFDEVVQQVEDHYRDRDKGIGSGYEQFKRWEYYHSTRLGPNGEVVDVAQRNFEEFHRYQGDMQEASATRAALTAAGDWESLGPDRYSRLPTGQAGGLGRVNCITVDPDDPDIIYVGTGGGLWRSIDGGGTWKALTDGISSVNITGIAIDPSSPQGSRTLYILLRKWYSEYDIFVNLLRSVDGGDTWYGIELQGHSVFFYDIKVHPTDPSILLATSSGGSGGIFRSHDRGLTWTNRATGDFYDIEFLPDNANQVVASAYDGIYRSTDGGLTWARTGFEPPEYTYKIKLGVTPANADHVYAICKGGVYQAGKFGGIYRSTDRGVTFSLRSDSPNILGYSIDGSDDQSDSWYGLDIAVSPTDANTVHVGGVNCWRSNDGGSTWQITSFWDGSQAGPGNHIYRGINELVFYGGTLYCGSDGGVYRSTDNADNWADISEGLRITRHHRLGLGSNGVVHNGAMDNGLNILDANGVNENWYGGEYWYGEDGMETAVSFDGDHVLGGISGGGLLAYDRRSSSVADITPNGQSGRWLTPFTIYPVLIPWKTDTQIIVGYKDVFTTQFDGTTPVNWTNISNGKIEEENYCDYVAVSPSDRHRIYVSKVYRMYKTEDGGDHWEDVSAGLPYATITYFVVHPTDSDTIFVALGNYASGEKVYRSTDGGNTWVNISGTLPNVPVNCVVHDHGSGNNALYVGTDVGVFYRDDDQGDWTPFYHRLPNVPVTELEIDGANGMLYASTLGRGIWRTPLHGRDCPDSLVLDQDLDGLRYYTANNISSTSRVKPFAEVRFEAANSVVLGTGFHVAADTMSPSTFFGAKVDPGVCSSGIDRAPASVSGRKGIYMGLLPGAVGVIPDAPSVGRFTGTLTDIELFPNPTQGSITVDLSDLEGTTTLQVFDLSGNSLISKKIKDRTTEQVGVDLSQLPTGIYLLRIEGGGQSITKKIVKD